jgi:hypothetical protein
MEEKITISKESKKKYKDANNMYIFMNGIETQRLYAIKKGITNKEIIEALEYIIVVYKEELTNN